ncbi:hypothetical protein NM688_g3455 [Phlebia brevispora]|uniref:Uncharacterized protein n=1 Tax=Phlebia brevispora TaxID=194682 RepID=A0ACC1T5W8_9APHY|nr:hypothetical protein NM688_g3455 [Phlebia brevispora]
MSDGHDSDVFDDNGPAIVDCDVLEAAKENIQPLAAGRRVTALSAILSTPHALRESRLASTRNRLRINVEIALEDEEDDPLEAYCRFVYWVVENYPQGHSAESGLLELLEEATRVLKDHGEGKWRGDIRYLKLWVLYASYVEKPALIFKFCLVNEIGTDHALLYEEYAIALERSGRKSEADEIYLLGLARKASPLDRLDSKHREFQKRMMSRVSPSVSEMEVPLELSNSTSHPKASRRAVLGETTRPSPTLDPQEAQDVFTLPSTTQVARPNGRLQVFVDPAGSAATEIEGAPWSELGTRKSRVKENLKEVSKAAGTTLRQAGKAKREAAARAPKMAVYRDPEGSGRQLGESSTDKDVLDPSVDVGPSNTEEPQSSLPPEQGTPPPTDEPSTSQKALEEPTLEVSPPVRRGVMTRSAAKLAAAQGVTGEISPLSTPTVAKKTRSTRSTARKTSQSGELTAPATSFKKGKSVASKAKITVLKDEELEPKAEIVPDPPTKVDTKGKARMTVFRDEPATGPIETTLSDSNAPSQVQTGSSKLMVYRDEVETTETPPPSQPNVPPKEQLKSTQQKSKLKPRPIPSKFIIFRDEGQEEALTQEMPPPVVAPRKASSSFKIPVFRDDDAGPSVRLVPPVGKIAVYRDEPEQNGDSAIPSTPKFTPFRGEPSTSRAPTSIMKDKGATVGGSRGEKLLSEAEALRKDPFKNYPEEEKILD